MGGELMPDSSLPAIFEELRADWLTREPVLSKMGSLGRAAWSEWAAEGDTFGLELPYGEWAKAVTADLIKVGPKGYIHGWIKVGAGAVGDLVHHPEHGHGKITRAGSKTVGVHFDSGAYHAFEHGGVGEGHFVERMAKKPGRKPKVAAEAAPAVPPAMLAAQTRQAVIDKHRPLAEMAAQLDEAHGALGDEGTPDEWRDVMGERVESGLAAIARPNARPDLAGEPLAGTESLRNANHRTVAARAREVAARNNITLHGQAGHVEPFDPKKHKPIGDHPEPGTPVEIVRPGTSLRHGGEDIQLSRADVHTADVVPVEHLKNGDYAKVVGEDQYGSPVTRTGYVNGSSPVRIGRRGRAGKRDAVAVSMSETPRGANGWRGAVYVNPGTHVTPMPKPADVNDPVAEVARLAERSSEVPTPAPSLRRSGILPESDARGHTLVPGDTVTVATDSHPRTDEKATVIDVGAGVGGHELATLRFADGTTDQLLTGSLVRSTPVESNYLSGLINELHPDPRFAQTVRGKPATSEVLRTLAGRQRGSGYESAVLRQEARRHRGSPLGDRLNEAAREVELLRRGNASPELTGRVIGPGTPTGYTPSPRQQAEALRQRANELQRNIDAGLPASPTVSRGHHTPAVRISAGTGRTAAGWEDTQRRQAEVARLRAEAEQALAGPRVSPAMTTAAEDRILSMDRPGAPAHIRESAAAIRERRAGGGDKFELATNPGEPGDGWITMNDGRSGPWGKYGAAGAMIRTVDKDGQERFLLVRGSASTDAGGKWQLPGGALDSLESPHQGAAREIHEELGATPDYLGALQPHGHHVFELPGSNGWRYTTVAATAPHPFTPNKHTWETTDAQWLTRNEIADLDQRGQLIPPLSGGKIQQNIMSLFPTPDSSKSTVMPSFEMPPDVDQQAVTELRAQFPSHNGDSFTSGYHVSRLDSATGNPGYSEENTAIDRLARKVGEPVARRVAWEADAETALARRLQMERPEDPNEDPYADLDPITPAEMAQGKTVAERELKERFANKKIVIRTRPDSLAQILRDGRMKTAFETGRSGGDSKADPSYRQRRARVEQTLFGIPTDAEPSKRPIYGYLVDEITPAKPEVPIDQRDEIEGAYGDVQVVLKDTVRPRATASAGDSIDDKVLPSSIDNPKWYSTNHISGRYDEAQVHGGVKTSDIAEVVFPSQPSESLRRQLDDAGVPWRTMSSTPTPARMTVAPPGRGGPPAARSRVTTSKPPKLPPAQAAAQALNHIRAGNPPEATLKALPVAALRELARMHGLVGILADAGHNVASMKKTDLVKEMEPWFRT